MSKAQQTQLLLGHGERIDIDGNVPATHRHAARALARWFNNNRGIEGHNAVVSRVSGSENNQSTYVYLDHNEYDGVGRSCISTHDIQKALDDFRVDWDMYVYIDGRISIHIE